MAASKKSTSNAAGKDGGARVADDGAEVADEHTEVVTYAAAIDVARDSGWCACARGCREAARTAGAGRYGVWGPSITRWSR
jgi:hypothetical protein